MGYGRWAKYVPVAERQEKSEKEIKKLQKKGRKVQPVRITGKGMATTFWGKAWCKHIESFSDYSNRLPRGRSYVRHGSVCHLSIQKGEIDSIVSGSDLYNIKCTIKPLPSKSWDKIKTLCAGQIGSVLELLQGKMSNNIMKIVTDPEHGLFPSPKDIALNCTCPDWANLCKHLAAVLYGIGARLDESPELLFVLRGVDYNELITSDIQLPNKGKGRRMIGNVSDVFGIDINQSTDNVSNHSEDEKTKPSKQKFLTPAGAKLNNKDKPEGTARKKVSTFKPTGATVARLRKKFKMNKTEFALLVGVSSVTITNWEYNKGKLSLKESSRVSLFDVSMLTVKEAWAHINVSLRYS